VCFPPSVLEDISRLQLQRARPMIHRCRRCKVATIYILLNSLKEYFSSAFTFFWISDKFKDTDVREGAGPLPEIYVYGPGAFRAPNAQLRASYKYDLALKVRIWPCKDPNGLQRSLPLYPPEFRIPLNCPTSSCKQTTTPSPSRPSQSSPQYTDVCCCLKRIRRSRSEAGRV
jgi:hypothetical protein